MNFKKLSIVAFVCVSVIASIEAFAISHLLHSKSNLAEEISGAGELISIKDAQAGIAAFQSGEKVPNKIKGVFFSKNVVRALIASHQQDIQANGIICAPVRMADGSLNVIITAANVANSAYPLIDNEIANGSANFTNNGMNLNAFIGNSFCPTNCGLIGQ